MNNLLLDKWELTVGATGSSAGHACNGLQYCWNSQGSCLELLGKKRFPSTIGFERLILKNRYENRILDTNGLRERGKCNGAKRTIVYDR